MLITGKNSDLQWSQPSLYIHARNADVHHNLNVSNPVPKVYTIYGTIAKFLHSSPALGFIQMEHAQYTVRM